MKISEILDIKPGVISIIGSGGKTTLMMKLAEELSEAGSGSVAVSTSARIRRPEDIPVYIAGRDNGTGLHQLFTEHRIVCIAGETGEDIAVGKLSAPGITFSDIAACADYVLVEADGSRGLPIKAHADYEPVIPDCTDEIILVIGADGFGRPAAEVCHRSGLYAEKLGIEETDIVTPETAAELIVRELQEKGIAGYFPAKTKAEDRFGISEPFSDPTAGKYYGSRRTGCILKTCCNAPVSETGSSILQSISILINKAETPEQLIMARRFEAGLEAEEKKGIPICRRIIAGSLWKGEYICLR